MASRFPRRETAAAKVGPRLEISPLEVQSQLKNDHGLSALITGASTWEPFAWKGNDLSAPLRCLYSAETFGLLKTRGDRATDVPIADIAADINEYLLSFGRQPVSENSVLQNLRKASLYAQAAVGVCLVPNAMSMTVRLVDKHETAESIELYFAGMEAKMKKLTAQLEHARAMNYPVQHLLESVKSRTGLQVLPASAVS